MYLLLLLYKYGFIKYLFQRSSDLYDANSPYNPFYVESRIDCQVKLSVVRTNLVMLQHGHFNVTVAVFRWDAYSKGLKVQHRMSWSIANFLTTTQPQGNASSFIRWPVLQQQQDMNRERETGRPGCPAPGPQRREGGNKGILREWHQTCSLKGNLLCLSTNNVF